MSLTLHHFRKEFRHLRWRWLAWLGVLLLDLAVNAEWIAPLSADFTPTFWTGLTPVFLWLGAVWLALDFCREDARADDNSFIALRPLPERSFWGSRFLVFTLLLMAPLTLQEGLYLLASGRPPSEILEGMAGRAFLAGAVLLWLLPMPLLAAGWARFGLAGAALLTAAMVKTISETWLDRVQIYHWAFYDGNSLAQAAWIGALALAALAWWQRGRGWSPRARGIAMAVLAIACYAMAWTPWLRPWSWRARQPDTVREIEARHPSLPPPVKVEITPVLDVTGEQKFIPRVWLPPLEKPVSWIPSWRIHKLESDTARPDPPLRHNVRNTSQLLLMQGGQLSYDNALAPYLSPTLPGDTLSVMSSNEIARAISLGFCGLPQDIRAPLHLRANLQADWLALSTAGTTGLQAGAKIRSPEMEVEILRIQPHVETGGRPKQGALTVTLRIGSRQSPFTGPATGPLISNKILLHDSANKLLWQNPGRSSDAFRAMGRGWVRHTTSLTFEGVLTQGTGLTEQSLHQLRILALQMQYAGSSRHSLELSYLKLHDHFGETVIRAANANPRVEDDHPREGFHREFKRLRKPAADASRAEAARYLAHVLTLAESLRRRGSLDVDRLPAHPGNDHAIADELAPLVLAHPDLVTTALSRPHGGGYHGNTFLRDLLDAAFLTLSPDRLTRREDGLWHSQGDGENEVPMLFNALVDGHHSWREFSPVVERALRERSVEPVLEMNRQWREQYRHSFSDEEVLENLRSSLSLSWLWALKGRGPASVAGRSIARQAYEHIVPPATEFHKDHQSLTEAAIGAGVEAALDHALTHTRLWEDQLYPDTTNLVRLLSVISRALGGEPVTSKTYRQFMESIRGRRAEDFRYDPESMTWHLKSTP
jgi:hypothetical protein